VWLDGWKQALEHVCHKLLEMLGRCLVTEPFSFRIAGKEVVHDKQRRN